MPADTNDTMITDEEIEQLPDDPIVAFIEFEKILRTRTNEILQTASQEQWDNSSDYYIEYMNRVAAAAQEFKIDDLKALRVPPVNRDYSSIHADYQQFLTDVDFFTTRFRLRRSRNRQNSVGLDGNTKARIHAYIQKIRIVLDKAELPESKRDLLFAKLDEFVLEVDKSRTNLQSIATVYLTICTVIGEGFNKLEPVRRFINSIAALMGKAKDTEDSLRTPLQPPQAQLEFPRRQLPAPHSTDEEEIQKSPF
jgi:hypothetical protein